MVLVALLFDVSGPRGRDLKDHTVTLMKLWLSRVAFNCAKALLCSSHATSVSSCSSLKALVVSQSLTYLNAKQLNALSLML